MYHLIKYSPLFNIWSVELDKHRNIKQILLLILFKRTEVKLRLDRIKAIFQEDPQTVFSPENGRGQRIVSYAPSQASWLSRRMRNARDTSKTWKGQSGQNYEFPIHLCAITKPDYHDYKIRKISDPTIRTVTMPTKVSHQSVDHRHRVEWHNGEQQVVSRLTSYHNILRNQRRVQPLAEWILKRTSSELHRQPDVPSNHHSATEVTWNNLFEILAGIGESDRRCLEVLLDVAHKALVPEGSCTTCRNYFNLKSIFFSKLM